jgi:translation initiation factor 1 (eIF-1/SUI1)
MYNIINIINNTNISMNITDDDECEEIFGVENTQNEIFTEIDKHVEIIYMKDGRRHKTCVYGLHSYHDDKSLKKFISKLKKNLGSNVIKDENNAKMGPAYIFSGKHIDIIRNAIISELEIPENKIKLL